jgi:Protein of unknown function (DUF3311)
MTDTTAHTHRWRPASAGRFALAALPWIGMLVLVPAANRVEPYVLGLPFLLFWIVLWVVLTAVCMSIVYLTDPRNRTGATR